MRRVVLVVVPVALLLAACGGSSSPKASGPDPGTAAAKTIATGSARFTVLVGAIVGGSPVQSSETGTISFSARRAHIYKLIPGSSMGQELIVDGAFTYTNANVEAALKDKSVKPWTKLDTRRLTPKQVKSHPDELAHVSVMVHLLDGVHNVRKFDSMDVAGQRVTEFRGDVQPTRVVAKAPVAQRASLAQALRNDYPARPFLASFWLDDAGRVRRVLVNYHTAGGTSISLDGRFSEFGITVDTTPPPARSTADITP
ncbi:MAG: hypothetical protein ABI990_04325 [Actinomycetota bacterium]